MMIDQNSKDTVVPKRYQGRSRLFPAFNAIFALVFFGPFRDLVLASLNSDYDSYIPFIPFISAYLLYINRHKIFSKGESSFAPGLLVMGAGILLLFFGRNQAELLEDRDYLAVVTCAIVLIWIGGFVFFHGIGALRTALFPLSFLFFMVPIPGPALEEIILFLQTGSAGASHILFQAAGIPVTRDGFVFYLPDLVIEVAKQCSGIRSSLALFITGSLAAYLFLRTGWARVLLMLSIAPIAVVKNGIRIFTLSALGVYWDKRILSGELHTKGGFVFFIIALVLAGAIIAALRWAEGKYRAR